LKNTQISASRWNVESERTPQDAASLNADESTLTCFRCEHQSADLVFLARAFHGVPDKPRLARAASAALVPGGRFAVVNWHQRPREQTMILAKPRGPRTELRVSPQQTIEAIELAELKFSQLV
jgi:trans-aconitate methyltransferase